MVVEGAKDKWNSTFTTLSIAATFVVFIQVSLGIWAVLYSIYPKNLLALQSLINL
jgi:hypothetical protein